MARCKAKSKRSGVQCKNHATPGYAVCRMHGSGGGRARLKPGNATAEEIRTRKQFLEALAGHDSGIVRKMIAKLYTIALSGHGSESAIRYCLDQIFGAPKTTVVTEIADRDLFARFVRATARHLNGEAFEAWLADLKTEMEAA